MSAGVVAYVVVAVVAWLVLVLVITARADEGSITNPEVAMVSAMGAAIWPAVAAVFLLSLVVFLLSLVVRAIRRGGGS